MKENLLVLLGCFGRKDDDFVSCSATENSILKIENHLHQYKEIMDFLDGHRLFDRPMFDYNAVRHFIFNMQEKFDQPNRKLWTEKKFQLYQKFTYDHRNCGIFIKLILAEEEAEKEIEPEKVFISGSVIEPTKKFKLVYGKVK